MAANSTQRTIFVYAHWVGIGQPVLMGRLYATGVRGKEIFSFEYEEPWLKSKQFQQLDPDLQLFPGQQFLGANKHNFGMFLDSSPDRWGRVLMKRREAAYARKEGRKERALFESDFLLGVYDNHRMGALRFKENPMGPFLDDNESMAAPPWTSIGELEHASLELEKASATHSTKYLKWLNMLMAPGSSLGGARPKASVADNKGNLWIAKFPSKSDGRDVGAWEIVAHDLAAKAGLRVAEAKTGKFYSKQHTFLTKRFDRTPKGGRIHFASAMTLLGRTDGTDFRDGASYLDIVGFILKHGSRTNQDLEELWRRIVFFVCVGNTDDHLRNHGFLLTESGWALSPAYDINPTDSGSGLSLNISETDNAPDLDLAREVAPYFRVSVKQAAAIIKAVKKSVGEWNTVAKKYGLSKSERDEMAGAFAIN